MANENRVLVIGASGFIGRRIVEMLYHCSSTIPRAGIRAWSTAVNLNGLPVEIALCDVMDKNQIRNAMDGVNCVIHCAYGSKIVTIQGTENALCVARDMGIERFIYLSTTEVYGNVEGKIDETFPFQYSGNPYSDSKIDAEKICWKYFDQGLPVIVIRPSIVYGPYGRTWTMELASRLNSSNWGIFKGHGEGLCNLVYIDDLVSAILSATHQKSIIGEAFNINGPEIITWNQYFIRFTTALGLPEPKEINTRRTSLRSMTKEFMRKPAKYILKHFMGPLESVSERVGIIGSILRSAEKSMKTIPTLAELSLYNRKAEYVTTKALEKLGYNPTINVTRGLGMTVNWLNHTKQMDLPG